MHPAFSVIFFTTMSGAGYGLLTLLGLGAYTGFIPTNDPTLGAVGISVALALVTAGLLASTFHLGHPERAWRALSQWRTSWLSREGLCAVFTYLPALVLGYGWVVKGSVTGGYSVAGLLAAILSVATVFTTSMIYASLKPIKAWHNRWVPVGYLFLGLMTGLILLNALLFWFDAASTRLAQLTMAMVVLAGAVKLIYWRFITVTQSGSSVESATGLGQFGRVSLAQSPHSHDNYLLKEMGFQIGRKHADKLRRISLICAFVLPLILTALALYGPDDLAAISVTLAVLVAGLGVVTERWLFFAEAKHTVTLYYGK